MRLRMWRMAEIGLDGRSFTGAWVETRQRYRGVGAGRPLKLRTSRCIRRREAAGWNSGFPFHRGWPYTFAGKMHLYLSSYLIGEQGQHLAHLARGKTALVVSNALDFSNDSERLGAGMKREIGRLADLGIPAEALDLRDYFASQDKLAQKIAAAGMLWVLGGNTFLLRKAMHLSGLDSLIHGKIDDEHFLYGGYSAGICVLSPSLRGIHLADEPEARSHGYEHPTLWEGLGIIDYYIVPHYRCDHFESESMEAVVDYYCENNLPYRAIPDGEVILDTTHGMERAVLPKSLS